MVVVEVALDQDLQRWTKIGAELKKPWTDMNGFTRCAYCGNIKGLYRIE